VEIADPQISFEESRRGLADGSRIRELWWGQ